MAGQRFSSGQVSQWGRDFKLTGGVGVQPGSIDPLVVAGEYLLPFKTASGNVASTNNLLFVNYRPISQPVTIDRIGARVSTLESGATLRLGLYTQNPVTRAIELLVDAGTIDCTTTGSKEITLASPVALTDGGIWIARVVQNSVGTVRFIGHSGEPPFRPPTTSVSETQLSSGGSYGFFQAGVSGALPTTMTVNATYGLPLAYSLRVGSVL